jgi:hypothetical protein
MVLVSKEHSVYEQITTHLPVRACFLHFAVDSEGLDFMKSQIERKSPSIRGRIPSEQSVEVREDHSLALLCFTTVNGLLAFVAAMFTTMLTSSAGWRYFWLVICLVSFALSLIALVRFCLSYQGSRSRDVS